MCTENSWACLWHWQGISLLFKRPVQSVFPERVQDSLRQTSTSCIQRHKNTSQSPLHFFWSKMCQGQQCNYRHLFLLFSFFSLHTNQNETWHLCNYLKVNFLLFLLQLTIQQQFVLSILQCFQ